MAIAAANGRVIVTLRSSTGGGSIMAKGAPPVSDQEMNQISERMDADYGTQEIRRIPFAGMIVAKADTSKLKQLLADPNVAAVEADRLWAATDLGEAAPPDEWMAYRRHDSEHDRAGDTVPPGVTQVTAPQAWAMGDKGDGVKVGILDSGGDPTHPDLSYAGGYDAIHLTTSGWQDTVAACLGHGTHIAGTIAARDNGSGIVGVAPHVQLYAIKVFQNIGGSCLAYTSSQIYGIQWAVTQGIRLVNVSIGGTFSTAYDAAIQSAAAQGTYVIAAAGNNDGALTYPGSSAFAIGVGGVDGSNTRASWSDFGAELDVMAPGVNIYSTLPGGNYGYKSGTSMATPHALGVAALLLSADPSLTFDQLRQEMITGALDLGTTGFDNYYGYGLVRAYNSLTGGGGSPLTLAVSPASRSTSVQQGGTAAGDNAAVTLSGDNASSTSWTATKKKSWTTLTTSSGTGSGTVAWSRNAAGLAVGTYVDTITIAASGATGSPATVIDTLQVTAATPPVLAVTPSSRSVSVQQGSSAPGDNATVSLTGNNASTTSWTATKKKSWTTLTTASGTGSGTVAWSRNASGLSAGTYVDTITITASGATGSPAKVIDTLKVMAPPLLAVSPSSRHASVQQGTAAPGDNAAVSLTGNNAATTSWTASRKKSWTTLTTASGTGSGTVAWSRNASGLAVGTYVDTITVTASGATGSPAAVIDTLSVTSVPVPLALAVAPGSRSTTVQQGTAAPGDSAAVTLTGDGASGTTWTATKKKSWTTLTKSTATGSAMVTWTRNASGLAAGTYVDTITVTAAGATGSPATVIDTLKVTAVPVPLTLAVAPASRSATVQQGGSAPADNATVTLTGDNASSTTWTATKKKSWTTLTTASGTGSGTVAWSRNASGLPAGTYVDTITVAAAGAVGSPSVVIDTLTVTALPVLAVSPASRSVSVQQGSSAPSDNATVSLTGSGASSISWTAAKKKSWTTLTTSGGTGSGTVAWSRNASGLAVGTYVDTITVTASGVTGSPGRVIDTLVVTTPPVLAVSPSSRSVSVQQGSTAPGDNAAVTLSGNNASSTTWTASRKKSWTTLTTSSGTGSGSVVWSRNASGLAVGTYVDTITVTASGATGSPAMVIDTLKITAVPIPLTLAVAPASRSVSVQQGTVAPGDNAVVSLSGDNASSTTWTATKKKSWTTLTASGGTGSGTVAWSRSTAGLAVGTYVDTITVTASGAGGSPARVIDTLTITAPPAPLTLAVTPGSRSVAVIQGTAAPGDNAAVTLAGNGASGTTWTATKKKSWTTLTKTTATGSNTLTWTRSTAGLAAGTYVDTITVTAPGAIGSPATVIDTLTITAAPLPLTLAVAPSSRSVTVQQGAPAPGDNAVVTLTGDNAASTVWTAAKKTSWTTLTGAGGTGSGVLAWNRDVSGLAVGTYVDTITVSAPGADGSPASVIDSLKVVAAPVPLTLAVAPLSRHVTVQQGSAAPGDNASVTLAGDNAGSTSWAASVGKSWASLTVAGGTGSGTVAWTRNAAGLAAGTYVDTVSISTTGATVLSAVLVDTMTVTAAPVGLSIALNPTSRTTTIDEGTAAPGDNAEVALAGDNAASTHWQASASATWVTWTASTGTGSGTLAWNRNAAGLAVGTWVDTITVVVPGTGLVPVHLYDTVVVNAVATAQRHFAFKPRGRRWRVLTSSLLSNIVMPTWDSAFVADDSSSTSMWTATAQSTLLQLVTTTGRVNTSVVWKWLPAAGSVGMHIDSVTVTLQQDPAAAATFVDTLDVIDVPVPGPTAAVDALFGKAGMTGDQLTVLDEAGNNNGKYDLGDFLAWVDRQHVQLSARLQQRLAALRNPQ